MGSSATPYLQFMWLSQIMDQKSAKKVSTVDRKIELEKSTMASPATADLQVVKGSRDLVFEFCDPLYISRTVRARIFKFGMLIDHYGY